MKKLFAFFTVFLLANLHANSYSIKLGTYKYLNNAKQDQKRIKKSTYIAQKKKYYGLYLGYFKDKQLARVSLKNIQKRFKDAYIVTSFKTIKKSQLKKDTRVLNIPKVAKIDKFKIAKNYYQIGAYEKALAQFDQILINEPNNNLARLEYARTLYMLGFYKDASIEFRKVLKLNPPKTVQNNINSYLKKIDGFSKKHYFYGSLGIGLTYDDNLGFNTHLPTTIYGGLELQNDTTMIRGAYANLNLALMHLYAGKNFNWSNALYSYSEIQNEDIDNLNFLNFISTLSKEYKMFSVLLPMGISKAWLDGSSYSVSTSANPTLNFQTDKSTYLSILMKYQNIQISKNHDKNYNTFGTKLSMTKLFDKLTLYANSIFEKDIRTNKKRYDISKDRMFITAGTYYQLLKKSVIYFEYQYNFDKYAHIDPALGYKREDKKSSYRASIKQKLSKSASAMIEFRRLENDSNINTYSYKKNSYNVSYQHNF